MESVHHTTDDQCPLCEQKLLGAHATMRIWFHEIKLDIPDAHVAWAYRGEADQEAAVAAHKSKLSFPNSAHNKSDDHGNPESAALDLFQRLPDGSGSWDSEFFARVNAASCVRKWALIWGRNWPHLGDSDHFQMAD